MEEWNQRWRFIIQDKVKQTDHPGIVHMIGKRIFAGNFEADWDIKINPVSPNDRDWVSQIRDLNIKNIESKDKKNEENI